MRPGWGATSLGKIVENLSVNRPDGVFMFDPGQRQISYSQMQRLTEAAACTLRQQGAKRGDRVVTLCQNQLAFFATAFGAWRLGCILVPINPEQRGAILRGWLVDADPTIVAADESGRSALRSLSEPPITPTVLDIAQVTQPVRAAEAGVDYEPTAPAMILFSSGTTGVSKGCVLSHEHLVWWGEEYCRGADLGSDDIGYSPGPFFHINAWWALNGSIVNGTPHAFDIRFSGSNFWKQAEAASATLFDYVGVITTILLRRSEMPSPKRRVRAAMGGGARAQEVREFKERFGIQLLECYGLTECCLPIFQRESEFRLGSIGKLSEYFEARLVQPDGKDAPPDGRGELWLRPLERRVIFSGYWRRPDLTAAAFHDGWFKTGDICRRDADGYFYYLDRQRAFIRRRGENISPFEVEGVVLDHPAVENCALIGVPAELGEEDLLLAVQPKPGAGIDPAELLRWCSERMARFMVPRYVRVMRLPLTPSERVERQTLRNEGVPDGTFDAEASGLFSGQANSRVSAMS